MYPWNNEHPKKNFIRKSGNSNLNFWVNLEWIHGIMNSIKQVEIFTNFDQRKIELRVGKRTVRLSCDVGTVPPTQGLPDASLLPPPSHNGNWEEVPGPGHLCLSLSPSSPPPLLECFLAILLYFPMISFLLFVDLALKTAGRSPMRIMYTMACTPLQEVSKNWKRKSRWWNRPC